MMSPHCEILYEEQHFGGYFGQYMLYVKIPPPMETLQQIQDYNCYACFKPWIGCLMFRYEIGCQVLLAIPTTSS